MKYLVYFSCILCFMKGVSAETDSIPTAKMFSLSSEEMVFASKLSDANRRRFCYTFSMKERSLVMQDSSPSLSPDQKVDQVFSSLYAQLESKTQAR